MKIEVSRLLIGTKHLISNNSGQHYRVISPKLKRLHQRAYAQIVGEDSFFTPPAPEEIKSLLNPKGEFSLTLEQWRCQQTFDLANYETSFKSIIDTYTHQGYWKDDSWKYLYLVHFNGGDHSVWDRAFRYEGDGLPDNIKAPWWESYNKEAKSTAMLRVIFETVD